MDEYVPGSAWFCDGDGNSAKIPTKTPQEPETMLSLLKQFFATVLAVSWNMIWTVRKSAAMFKFPIGASCFKSPIHIFCMATRPILATVLLPRFLTLDTFWAEVEFSIFEFMDWASRTFGKDPLKCLGPLQPWPREWPNVVVHFMHQLGASKIAMSSATH